jgi:hypothetical protein
MVASQQPKGADPSHIASQGLKIRVSAALGAQQRETPPEVVDAEQALVHRVAIRPDALAVQTRR